MPDTSIHSTSDTYDHTGGWVLTIGRGRERAGRKLSRPLGALSHMSCADFEREMSLGCSGLDLEPGVGVFWCLSLCSECCVWHGCMCWTGCVTGLLGLQLFSGCMPSVCGGGPGDRLAPCTSICGLAASGPHTVYRSLQNDYVIMAQFNTVHSLLYISILKVITQKTCSSAEAFFIAVS